LGFRLDGVRPAGVGGSVGEVEVVFHESSILGQRRLWGL
jgi:hypothetical protein